MNWHRRLVLITRSWCVCVCDRAGALSSVVSELKSLGSWLAGWLVGRSSRESSRGDEDLGMDSVESDVQHSKRRFPRGREESHLPSLGWKRRHCLAGGWCLEFGWTNCCVALTRSRCRRESNSSWPRLSFAHRRRGTQAPLFLLSLGAASRPGCRGHQALKTKEARGVAAP